MRSLGPVVALVAAAMACDRRGGEGVGFLWVGDPGAPRILTISGRGEIGVGAQAPALDAPVRAISLRRDGSVVALQETGGGVPPAVVLSPSGARLTAFDAVDGAGATLFPPATPPWAAAQAQDGRIWVTGLPSPSIFLPDGRFDAHAVAVPGPTSGITALPDGRMLVTWGTNGAAVYAADGASVELLAPELSLDPAYAGLDAVATRADGTVIVAVMHHGVTLEGVLVEAIVEPGRLAARSDPAVSARLPSLPSSLVLGTDFVLAGASLAPAAPPMCTELLSGDLATRRGCLVPGAYRGIARLR